MTQRTLDILVFSAKGGGTGCALRARYIAEALAKRGHRARLVDPIPSLPYWFDMVLSTLYYLGVSLRHRSDAAMLIKPYPTAVPALWVQRLKGAKLVIDVDDLDYDYSHGWFRGFHQWLQLPWPKWADLVTYHTPFLLGPLKEVFHVPAGQIVQLPQGVDLDLFHADHKDLHHLPPVARHLHKTRQEGPLLVFTAHLNVACDLEPVLQAFKLILKRTPKARLLVAGGGPDEGRFKALTRDLGISASVFFTGYLAPQQVAACLRLADAALVYYRDNAVNRHRASMKLREALASGAKVAATEVGEAAQFDRVLFGSDPAPEAFAKAIERALKARKTPGGASKLVKKWDWKLCVENLEQSLVHREETK
ncbi:MAG TPA: glycosyltransferase [bacterium]|nr:glycosyltransferase [bacterium]